MEFIDYDRLISDKKSNIIDSYVSQYGEDFRKLIENILYKDFAKSIDKQNKNILLSKKKRRIL